jgi:hypothetical protein
MMIANYFSTFSLGHFCGNDRNVENHRFPPFLCKSLQDLHITTKPSLKTLYIFSMKLVKVYADSLRKTIRLLTQVDG